MLQTSATFRTVSDAYQAGCQSYRLQGVEPCF